MEGEVLVGRAFKLTDKKEGLGSEGILSGRFHVETAGIIAPVGDGNQARGKGDAVAGKVAFGFGGGEGIALIDLVIPVGVLDFGGTRAQGGY